LDRNGLRPSRYCITDDDLVIMGSESGVLPVPESKIVRKWRLQPGKMFLIDLEQGRMINDEELKSGLANSKPYKQWIENLRIRLDDVAEHPVGSPEHSGISLLDRQQAFGYSQEDFKFLMAPMAATGEEAFVPSTTTKQAGVFTQYRYDNGAWGLEGGARVDQTQLKSGTAAYAHDFNTVSASLGSFYRPTDHNFVGLSVTRSERAPSDVELLADGPHGGTGQYIIGDPRFRTEVGTSLELTGHMMVDGHNPLSLDAHVYTSHFDNFIDLRPTGQVQDDLPVFQYVQTDADLYGLEIEASAHLFSYADQAVSLHAAYDYTHGKTAIGPVVRIPPQALTLKLQSVSPRWDSYVEVRGVDSRNDRLAAFETPTDGYVTVNLFTSYKLPQHPGTSLFAEVRNVGDVEMREATSSTKDSVVGAGRSLRLGVVSNF
jgi:iron complex outermembrane receptor protein